MALYLKQFSTHSEYEQYINGSDAILPNVSICTTEGDVHYNPYVDPYAGHEYVEIGGLKWATMNVGANSITDKGLYFSWGDTQGYTADQVGSGEGQKYFYWDDYKYNPSGNGSTMTKYNSADGKTVLDASDDVARANWGGQWRMPTSADYAALADAVYTTWTTNYKGSGVAGLVCTDKTNSSKVLFLPTCGLCSRGSIDGLSSGCYYWSGSLNTNSVQNAICSLLTSTRNRWGYGFYRCYGMCVRGVVG